MEGEISRLIRDLDNFQTRKHAKTALIQLGKTSVEGLADKLRSPLRDNVKWNIIDILSKIGDERAVPALKECAENPTFESVCMEAVARITGEDTEPEETEEKPETDRQGSVNTDETGSKPSEEPEAKVIEKVVEKVVEVEKPVPSLEDIRNLAEEIIKEQEYSDVKEVVSGGEKTGYRFTVKTDSNRRRQKITFSFDTSDEEGNKIICMYSVCCEADPDYYEKALRWNQNIANGSICITDLREKPHFVLLKHLSFEEADKDTVIKLIGSLGERADKIEKVLTGAQDFR